MGLDGLLKADLRAGTEREASLAHGSLSKVGEPPPPRERHQGRGAIHSWPGRAYVHLHLSGPCSWPGRPPLPQGKDQLKSLPAAATARHSCLGKAHMERGGGGGLVRSAC